ncbi:MULTISPECIES: aspartate aminotransferase family protein [unclassified Devosia]|uniref:aspartate aminotransferase family protein n=1 Tax=unclassified Devosia TaxID=196773 RepID=UPI00086ABC50|nr:MULTISPECIES: aspartate aminotransferase family protein [unclassified Devosia]MBN9360961.1 aspartate aminotransferase family protein [Devosia sp.]ODS86190.1 MAG: acetylornithine transaminase [Devosia sp. SCN 66-27]OJX22903.1 MAG: acetylornithine transaminase [Devosia sp. 66-14]
MSALYGTYARSDLAFERGEGVRLFAQDGTPYLDFHAGVAVNALGHGDPHMVAALKAAAEKVWHTANTFTIPEQERLGQRLVDNTFADACFFTNSGTEAVECAVKTARHYFWAKGETDRYEIIAFTGSFHGRTMGMIAASGNEHYLEGFGPPLAGFKHLAPGDLKAVEAAITPKTCAILIEPVQGEGGVTAMTGEYMRGLRALCDKHGMLLILDEVQCGYGRTGKFFAHEWSGIEPDIMAVAKGIGAGFPLGACLAKGEVAKSMIPGTHGSTYGGNPLASAMGNAVLDRMLAPGFFDHVDKMGQRLNWHLQQLAQRFPSQVLELRGKGLLAGIRIASPVRDVAVRLRDEHHMLAMTANENVLRLLPPLVVTEADIEEAMGKLTAVFEAIEAEAAGQASGNATA